LDFTSFVLSESKFDEEYTKINKLTYEGSLKARVKLLNKSIGTSKEQEIFMADVPLMTKHGTFIINGVERVIVPQLTRSFGVFFTEQELKTKRYFGAKIIPARGVWIEIESDTDGAVYVRVDKKRKFSVSSLLRVLGLDKDEAILKAFSVKTKKPLRQLRFLSKKTLQKQLRIRLLKYISVFVMVIWQQPKMQRNLLPHCFYAERYDLSKADDIDHLGQRRVRFVGEILQQQKVRMGMMQIKRNIQDRMSIIDVIQRCRLQIINQRPLQARIKEFFTPTSFHNL
jgi:DNA-directed RNA polymerase subunit beta